MKFESRISQERAPEYQVSPPPTEMLLQGTSGKNFWPDSILNNQELKNQKEIRTRISGSLNLLYKKFPDATARLEDILEANAVPEQELATLYNDLSGILEDSANHRIALYLPFELFQNKKSPITPKTIGLTNAVERFTASYKKAWEDSLHSHELRADFMDGDVPEVEYRTGPLPVVSKAAHLIPKLVEHGILTVPEIRTLLNNATDDTLRNSIIDTLPILQEMNILKETDQDLLSQFSTLSLQNLKTSDTETLPKTNLQEIISACLSAIAIPENYEVSNDARTKWLREKNEEKNIAGYSEQIAKLLLTKSIASTEIIKHLEEHSHIAVYKIITEAIFKTITNISSSALEDAQEVYKEYRPALTKLWEESTGTLHDTLHTNYLYLFARNVIDTVELSKLGIERPSIDAPFHERTKKMGSELSIMKELTNKIARHPKLSKMLYPVTVVLGSRMKGYARGNADLDIAIFVRPGTKESERTELQSYIEETFDHKIVGGHAMEFWLQETGVELVIQNYENPDPQRGDSSLPHPLLGAWCGDEKVITELYKKLMPGYLYSKGKTILGEDMQSVLLKEMEHDTLQYRLMHKGYTRLFPRQGGIQTQHTDAIDGESMFYDSGYRRLATKLFIDRIFLPQLEK